MVAAITNHGGGDIDELSLSKSTARRYRGAARAELSSEIKKTFTCSPTAQINFDGKLHPNLEGFSSVNRLAVVLVQKEENKILCIARTGDSTGKTEAESVKKSLDDWQLTSYIVSMGFDTTSSNTGVNKGACTLLQVQQLLDRNLLWMACRHHILELVIGNTFTTLFGDTKSPEVTLFKPLKTSWDSLDLDSFILPDIPSCYQREKEELTYINSLLSPENVKNLP